jgi:magnesium-transporting ATPase (P-type)
MEVAVILALGLQDWLDAGIIIGILLLNAIVGWYQEKQAADVVASLKGDIAMKARVVRNGTEQEIRARELVPGDIVSWPAMISHVNMKRTIADIQIRSSSKKDMSCPLMLD